MEFWHQIRNKGFIKNFHKNLTSNWHVLLNCGICYKTIQDICLQTESFENGIPHFARQFNNEPMMWKGERTSLYLNMLCAIQVNHFILHPHQHIKLLYIHSWQWIHLSTDTLQVLLDIHVKWNTELPRQKLHSIRRGPFHKQIGLQ